MSGILKKLGPLAPVFRWLRRFAAPVCLALSVLALGWGAHRVLASRCQIALVIQDVEGDTAGIDALDVRVTVAEPGTGLQYSQWRGGAQFNAGRPPFVRYDSWWDWPQQCGVVLRPVSGVREVIGPADPERYFFQGANGEPIQAIQKRVYADVFEVVPLVIGSDVAVRLEPDAPRLYMDGAEDVYLESVYESADQMNDPHMTVYPWLYMGEISRWANITSQVLVGEQYMVPAFDGLYGHTAVYAVGDEDIVIDMDNEGYKALGYATWPVREVYPIDLKKGEDEICGFVQCDSALLLAVRRGDRIELTKLLPEGSGYPTVTIPARIDLEKPLQSGALMLFHDGASSGTGDPVTYRVLDTETMRIVASADGARIGGQRPTEEIGVQGFAMRAFTMADGWVYVGSEAYVDQPGGYDSRCRVYITQLDAKGNRTGCAEVFTGLEDDAHRVYWASGAESLYTRELAELSLSGGAR